VVEEHRLDRIEQKLDKLAEAVSNIVRVEEQMLSLFKRVDRFEKRLDEQEDDLRAVSEKVIMNSKTVANGERLFWILASAAVSIAVYMSR